MKRLHVTFEGIMDTTGYLFSFAKCLSAALRSCGFADTADDAIAASGFAFRMWVDEKELCPSATSIWDFKQQKPWVENGGLRCAYVERLWHEETLEKERRAEAIVLICRSIEDGFAPIAWDISGCEWGLIIGYDNETNMLLTLKISGEEALMPYDQLGRLEIPILSVLAVNGKTEKPLHQIVDDTKKLAAAHLRGEEWCENVSGMAAYDALIGFVQNRLTEKTAWNLEYMLGTYAALKWYAWKFFEKHGEEALAGLYQNVYENWQAAFEQREDHEQVAELLKNAKEAEMQALVIINP